MPTYPIIKGDAGPLEQPKVRTWTADRGWATVRVWKGAKEVIQSFIFTEQEPPGYESIRMTDEGEIATVEITYADSAAGVTDAGAMNVEWELLGNDLEKDLKTHSSLASDDDAILTQLAAAEKEFLNPVSGIDYPRTEWDLKAKTLWRHLSKGTKAYLVTQYVLRKTIKVARDAGVLASLVGVNTVEEPAGVPSDLFLQPTDQGDGPIEWLKKPPTVRFLGRGKFSIVQEWWGGKWSGSLYLGSETP